MTVARISSSEPTGEASVRGISAELRFAERRSMMVEMRAMYEQETL
jgi:hypothetical protein